VLGPSISLRDGECDADSGHTASQRRHRRLFPTLLTYNLAGPKVRNGRQPIVILVFGHDCRETARGLTPGNAVPGFFPAGPAADPFTLAVLTGTYHGMPPVVSAQRTHLEFGCGAWEYRVH
jgi:hypothetical protein